MAHVNRMTTQYVVRFSFGSLTFALAGKRTVCVMRKHVQLDKLHATTGRVNDRLLFPPITNDIVECPYYRYALSDIMQNA